MVITGFCQKNQIIQVHGNFIGNRLELRFLIQIKCAFSEHTKVCDISYIKEIIIFITKVYDYENFRDFFC